MLFVLRTMKKSLFAGLTLMVLLVAACRKESDHVMSYAFNDYMAFERADTSFAGKFDVFWHGLNANYAMWDIEKSYGLDWDEWYDRYYPKFEELDNQKDDVTDDQLRALMQEMVYPLHDGHLAVQFNNHDTDNFLMVSPGGIRAYTERKDEYLFSYSFKPSLDYYRERGELLEYKTYDTNTLNVVLPALLEYLAGEIAVLEEKEELTADEQAKLDLYEKINTEVLAAQTKLVDDKDEEEAYKLYNEAALRYEYLNIPGFAKADDTLIEYPLKITYALFKGNIAYLRIDRFLLSAFLMPEWVEELFDTPSEAAQASIDEVVSTWTAWFQAIQTHHKKGDLGGVVLDVRSNGGGYMYDFQFVLGALVPSGGMHVMNARFKRGPGRYDFSPVMPQYMYTYKEEHVTVTEPIVVLCNCYSVSMSEQTAIGAGLLDNGVLIGTRTWGGFSALSGAESYSNNYAGHVGVKDETPVYCYIPGELAITLDGKVLEGEGLTPDIVVPFDEVSWNNGAGPDNQLDRALQYCLHFEK